MTIELSYYVCFGPGDCSDTFDWEVELTPEEEEAFRAALAAGDDPEAAIPDAIDRAYHEIYAQEKQNFEDMGMEMDGELIVYLEEPEYDEEAEDEEDK